MDQKHSYSKATRAGQTDPEDRNRLGAVLRGLRMRCPNCGAGPLLDGYLKVRGHCTACREPLRGHKLHNEPVYLTIAVVFVIMAPLLSYVFQKFQPEPMILFTIFAVGCVGLSLYLLPRLKGAIVALQWARREHGFAPED